MPIYMDRHDVSDEVTAENVAELHQHDLKIQDKFNCRGLTYWFDGERKTAFCLIEAPDKESLQRMHNHAHGEVPNKIIEVDPALVESFLGRIEDPKNINSTGLNIIDDPAFRVIMAVKLKIQSLKNYHPKELETFFGKFTKRIAKEFNRTEENMVKQNRYGFLASFKSVKNAINCALEMQYIFDASKKDSNFQDIELFTGLSTGSPIEKRESLFEDSVRLANLLCDIEKAKITTTNEVKSLFENKNFKPFSKKSITVLHSDEESLLCRLMDFIEDNWKNPNLKVEDINKHTAMSKSQAYRKIKYLTGKSPNSFLKEFRLIKALEAINTNQNTVSEIAYNTGFNSPSYFSKCFQKRFGIQPSVYLQSL